MKFKKYFLFTLILAFVLSITTYSMEKTEVFNIDNEWTIPLPEDWQMEGKSPYQQYYSFYPSVPFYSTIKIYNYDIEENQNIDFLEDLKKKYPNSNIKEKKVNLNKIKVKNTKVGAYEYSFDENGTKLYAISYFILIKRDLLIANFYSISEKEIEKMLEYFYSIEKIN
ncbi:hypothetical protein [Fusobacterium polymorphum]|uniref:PsbP C-terminal domain-containing protein n=1 Tax=Fusobacterium polymorphum ATCC 10953 TaxID=393480 RepID=A5TUU0_FUSNP|nr:hypothetical protein [Fusobacterium polymorphum]EDK88665.1 hypothetical protein FNP_0864 [Fusobacterium polymorphum ATCC 10953]UTI52047.1 hypothetical protein NLJ26_06350 [Fusobacterium polymorphum]WRL68772.1 hypothetical protein VKN78_01455 [Fusobacterium polymorphum]